METIQIRHPVESNARNHAASYEKLLDIAEEAKVLEGIRRGMEDMKAGRTQPLEAALADIRRDLKLPQGSFGMA